MSLIKNLVKEPQHKRKAQEDDDEDGDVSPGVKNREKTAAPAKIIKSAIDIQRLKLEKLMKNPEKMVVIPEPRKEKDFLHTVPTFVRNVMGSSAGAGSGEFHVYRHLRRKEYARQKMIQATSIKQKLDDAYQMRMEENRRKAEEKTAKKRAKRLKKKQRAKRLKSMKNTITGNDKENPPSTSNNSESSDDNMENEAEEIKSNIQNKERNGCKEEQEEGAPIGDVEGGKREAQEELAALKDEEKGRRDEQNKSTELEDGNGDIVEEQDNRAAIENEEGGGKVVGVAVGIEIAAEAKEQNKSVDNQIELSSGSTLKDINEEE